MKSNKNEEVVAEQLLGLKMYLLENCMYRRIYIQRSFAPLHLVQTLIGLGESIMYSIDGFDRAMLRNFA